MLVLLAAALVAGEYASGYVLYWLTNWNIDPGFLTYWTYIRAVDVPEFAPFVLKMKLSGVIGFALPIVVWLGISFKLLQARPEPTHGNARFADLADLKKAGLLKPSPDAVLIGKYKGYYLWLSGAQHVITISPTRSGKTTSIAIPVLLSYLMSMIVLDIKGELHASTSGWRAAQGQKIWVWAPYDDAGKTHRFNPMTTFVGMDPGKRIGEIQTIAAILYPDQPGGDPFWISQSRAAFTAFTSFMFERWDEKIRWLTKSNAADELMPDPNVCDQFPSFERVLRLSSGTDEMETKQLLTTIVKDRSYAFVSSQTKTVFRNLIGLPDETFSSVIASMQAPLQQFLSPILAAATNATDFKVEDFRKILSTLYVIIPTNKLDESAKLLNIFFSTVIGKNLDKQLGEEPDLKYQLLMLMDEFTAMGRVDVWAKRISISASYGVRDLCIIQSRAQLKSAYGENDAQNFITNHGAQIAFAPREQADANEYSEMLGYKTVRKRQQSTSRGGGGQQVSTSYVEERRALMLPQEVKEMPSDDELVFYEGCRPIRAKKNWFFKDKMFKERAAIPPVEVSAAQRSAAIIAMPAPLGMPTDAAKAALSRAAKAA
ncbi:type IV secretory system conjugative DNA transfer family protein [Luteibacter sp. 3190]|uniref:type IV secretory system conjugative DNA transfer family protein n=1 Tax=Luteibacter sp. 3190 TaxID=2817736 RepID=UPI0028634155|nr:type IV secretory system conjugative DNA transfer family protein [Luteibacter sp. 3190]MDR6938208.1 type IV secretion system protein VirD4 [Luteibacter sp. 3190]